MYLDSNSLINLFLLGDFNSRVGCKSLDLDTMPSRILDDSTIKPFGTFLNSLCDIYGLTILNGVLPNTSSCTYYNSNKKTVLDLAISSVNLLSACSNLQILGPIYKTEHYFLLATLSVNAVTISDTKLPL